MAGFMAVLLFMILSLTERWVSICHPPHHKHIVNVEWAWQITPTADTQADIPLTLARTLTQQPGRCQKDMSRSVVYKAHVPLIAPSSQGGRWHSATVPNLVMLFWFPERRLKERSEQWMHKADLVLIACVAFFHVDNYYAHSLRLIFSTCRLDMTIAS
jgi:hypothetical protein